MTSRPARRRGWRLALYVAVALVVLGLVERGGRLLVSRRLLATAGAQWIWAPGALERSEPLAFYAVRDFELGTPPAAASIHVLADEAYILFVNEKRVGSGAYFAGAPLDTYRLDSLLRPGWNRIAIELRSGRGAGGLLCALNASGERKPIVSSNGSWKILRDATGVVESMRASIDGEPALVWQSPPTGGWGVPRLGPERPRYDTVAIADRGGIEPPLRLPFIEPRPTTESGSPLVNDFGRPVQGYVQLFGLAAAPRHLHLDVGLERTGGESVDVLLASGQTTWSSTEVRTLRYVGSPYLPEGATLGVTEVAPELAALDAERSIKRRQGVFGVDPPNHDSR